MHRFTFLLLLSTLMLNGKIYQIKHIREVLDHVKKFDPTTMLVVFDLDNTLIEPEDENTSSQGFYAYAAQLLREGYSKSSIYSKIECVMPEKLHKSLIHPVESNTHQVLKHLHDNHIPVIALTNSKPIAITFENLAKAGIDLTHSCPWLDRCYMFTDLKKNAYYSPGVLFSWGNDKGAVLELFLKKVNFKPTTLLFIDDQTKNAKSLEKLGKRLSIKNHEELRYGYLDEKVIAFYKRHPLAKALARASGSYL